LGKQIFIHFRGKKIFPEYASAKFLTLHREKEESEIVFFGENKGL